MKLPDDFVIETRKAMGEELFARLLDGLEQEPPASIRVNDARGFHVVVGDPIPWCSCGYYLPTRPGFTFDPLLHAGCYYVQEAASMFLAHVLRYIPVSAPPLFSDHRLHVLDLCAAPGGKSTILSSALPEGSLIVCNEPVARRARTLSENMQKWHLCRGGEPTVTNNNARDFSKSRLVFDLILCDVPCSGEGMFRKNEKAIGEWSVSNVRKCQQLQREIVSDIWPCLSPGGFMVYSTCTFNVHENEENVAWIADELGAEVIEIPVEREWNVTHALSGHQPACRFIPGISRGEGLFMALLRKKGEVTPGRKRHEKELRGLRVIPNDFLHACREAEKTMPATPCISLSYEQSIAYLRGETIALPPEVPRGIVAVGFQGQVLGLVKNVGSRANNLYPKEWRIKSTHVPEYQEIVKTK